VRGKGHVRDAASGLTIESRRFSLCCISICHSFRDVGKNMLHFLGFVVIHTRSFEAVHTLGVLCWTFDDGRVWPALRVSGVRRRATTERRRDVEVSGLFDGAKNILLDSKRPGSTATTVHASAVYL